VCAQGQPKHVDEKLELFDRLKFFISSSCQYLTKINEQEGKMNSSQEISLEGRTEMYKWVKLGT